MKTGDRVVYIGNYSHSRHKHNTIYCVEQIKRLECGCAILHVGLPSGLLSMRCQKCGTSNIPNQGYVWGYIESFRPIEYNSAHDELINKDIVKETSDIPIKEPVHEESKRAI